MKKNILLIALTSLCVLAHAQYVVRIVRVLPAIACNGEEITVNYQLQPSPLQKDSAEFQLDAINQTIRLPKMKYVGYLNSQPTETINGVFTFLVQFTMPTFYYNGPVFIECDGDMLGVNYKTCTTGMNEISASTEQLTSTYTDILGRPTQWQTNTLLFEQRGDTRRKIIIQE